MVKKKPGDSFGFLDDHIPNAHSKISSGKSSRTPMKMLIAQELSREMELKHKPPNVVARLMGLDALPLQQSDLDFSSGGLKYHRQVKEYKDIYEVRKQPSRKDRFADRLPRKGRIDESLLEKRMALVRQKFTEAKHLVTDESLLHSKEFQDALEVLSSHRHLVHKFLEGPKSLFSKHFRGIQTVLPSETKRITVLKPSKSLSIENIGRYMDTRRRDSMSSSFVRYKAENSSRPTRIVVLKPNPGMPYDMKATLADFSEGLGAEEAIESREVAKEVTQEMQRYLSAHRRDEALLSSSVLSNGYAGDESSFNEEGCCNASECEAATPTSWHPWDCNNEFDSPYSISSLSRASCSTEPSVITEAKNQISERCAMIASDGFHEEQNKMQRSSSTLGEMLSFHEVKTEKGSGNLNISSRRSCGEDAAARNLRRSNSLPVSSSVLENIELNEVVPNTLTSKTVVPKNLTKFKNGALSFKGKFSSFFSRSKKSDGEKHIASPSVRSDDRIHSNIAGESCQKNVAPSESLYDGHSEASIIINIEKFGGRLSATDSLNYVQLHATPSATASKNSRENLEIHDQPNPISVFKAPFENNDTNISHSSIDAITVHPQALSRSRPIESISRTLTWDSPHRGRPISNSSKLSVVLSDEREEQERFFLMQKLLSSANLMDTGHCKILSRWHTLDSPLDPMLLDEFLERKEVAKCRERRSNQRLLFDCVNAALMDIGSYPYMRVCGRARRDAQKYSLVEEVWRLVRDRFSPEDEQLSYDYDNLNVVIEGVVKRDVAGSGWSEEMCSEVDKFGEEVGAEILEELVKEALADLTDSCM